jgi:hypothetical protein
MIMKRAVLILYLLLVSNEAQAISRYNSTNMSCDEVRATIAGDGEAIMHYRSRRDPSLQLYGRYVRNRLFCKHDEIAERKYIPAADTRSCPVSMLYPGRSGRRVSDLPAASPIGSEAWPALRLFPAGRGLISTKLMESTHGQ